MNGRFLARGAAGLLAGAVIFAATDGGRPHVALADDARPTSTPVGCTLRGTGPVPRATQLFDQPTGGRVIANFTGALVPIAIGGFPADPSTGRSHIVTSLSGAQLRIDGYGAASAFTVYTTRDVPIAAGHVWISSAQKVRLVQAASNALTGEITVLGSASQNARGVGPCDAFSLQRGTPQVLAVPGNGRLYSSKATQLELYDQPSGNVVFTLHMIEGASQLFWSTETRGAFVHLTSRADITVDAWAKAAQLDALKRGEMVDQVAPPQSAVAGAQLALDGTNPPRVVVATRELPIRARRDDKEKPIGVLEVGAEVYVMETMAGWSNLLPKHLGFQPGTDGGFWIPSADVPRR
jgi:hypothetical protein